ncbi:glycosyltransferase family 39 protein [bacterium]|nr:glycosyltransferase family 39 protein [bacterium]
MAEPKNTIFIKIPEIFSGKCNISTTAYLAALLAAIILTNLVWLFVDARPLAWDESTHYMGAVGYFKVLQQGGWGLLHNLLYLSDFYPPLTEFIAGLFFLLTSPSTDTAAFLDVFFIGGIIWVLFLLGKRTFGQETGILAGYVFAAGSAVIIQSKVFMLDISLAFFVTLGFYAFLASEQFLRKRWVITYGVVLGLAMLTKWSALFFLAFPPLIAALVATVQKHKQLGRIWFFVLLAYAIAGCLAGPWYVVHFIKLVKNTSGYIHARGVLENDPSLLSPKAWFYYLGSVFKQTSIPMAVVIYIGLIWFFIRHKVSGWMAIWLAGPYLILMLIRNKDHRYIIPLLPLLSLAGLTWIQGLKKPVKEKVVLGIAVLALIHMGYVHLGAKTGWLHKLTQIKIMDTPIIDSLAPDARAWPLGAILAEVEERSRNLGRKPILRIIPDAANFTRVNFVVEQSSRKNMVRLSSTSNWPMFTDYAVTKTGSLGLDFNTEKPGKISLALQIESRAQAPRFELLQKYSLPDKSEALLYARQEVLSELSSQTIEALVKEELHYLLSAYIQDAKTYAIDIVPFSETETRLGRFKKILVRAEQGLVGDFKHNPLGVPFQRLNVELDNLILDIEKLEIGKLLPYTVGRMKINEVLLEAEDLNQSISQATGAIQSLRVSCQANKLTARWTGLFPVQATISLRVIPDPQVKTSQNLRFQIHSVKLGWLPIPGWWLQPVVEDFNPLFKLSGFSGDVVLGRMKIQDGTIHMGTTLQSTRKTKK